MMIRLITIALAFLLVNMAQGQESTKPVDFDSQVLPILQKHCASCHNDEDSESDFNVSSVSSILKGSTAGAAVNSGDGAASHIIKLMRGSKEPIMPPEDEFERVPDSEIEIVERWINEGARPSEKQSTKLAIKAPKWESRTRVEPSILAADWSPDGRLIATAQYGVVKLLDAKTLEAVHRFDSLAGKVNAVQFSADGKTLVAATGISGVGGRAILWDATTYEQLSQFDGHNDVMYDAVVSPDGKLLATSAYDKSILVWDLSSGKELRRLKGHNSAVYDLEFSPDSRNVVSASDDQTLKVWNVETGRRLDTLGQPLKEQFTTAISPDGELVVGGGRDNRLRVWQLKSRDRAAINPILFSRFAHEGSIVRLKFSVDGSLLFSSSEDRTIKVWETGSFLQVGMFALQPEVCSAICVSPDATKIFVGRLDGTAELIDVPQRTSAVAVADAVVASESHSETAPEPNTIAEAEPNNVMDNAQLIELPVVVDGVVAKSDPDVDKDLFRFSAKAGQALMFETMAARNKSPVDTRIEILDSEGQLVPQVVLRAVRDSWFTFRGKDSSTSDDFRVHNWEEMKLNEFIYSNGEVNKLFLHPRGPDSGFRVYPGTGKRFSYFGTTAMTHALHEPCYIVEPWPPGTTFLPNGLPIFEINYENDDDSRRELGKDSRLKFIAPRDGDYIVRVTDVRGFGGGDFKYQLHVREANPSFEIRVKGPKSVFPGSGAEFQIIAKRKDGFEGPIRIEITNLPANFHATSPLVIEAGHVEAFGTVYALEGAKSFTEEQAKAVTFVATAKIAGESVTEKLNGVSVVKVEEKEPKASFAIVASPESRLPEKPDFENPLTLEIRPGESIQAYIVALRNGHEGPIKFGNEGSGRNLPHGVKVDDIGLNGLMIPKGQSRQRFFIKAESFVQPQSRTFHLKANTVNNVVCPPVILRVLPAKNDQLTQAK